MTKEIRYQPVPTKHKVFRGDDGAYGIECGGVLYEAMFLKPCALRIAALNDHEKPPIDWLATRKILQREGFTAKTMFHKNHL